VEQTIEVQSPRLKSLIHELERISRPLTMAELCALALRHPLSAADINAFVEFEKHSYCHRPIAMGEHFELSCLGWRPGQASPIHNHRDSACCVQVLCGTMRHIDFPNPDDLNNYRVMEVGPGRPVARNDRQIHQIVNPETASENLVTLHLYSPPLRPMVERQLATASEIESLSLTGSAIEVDPADG